MEDANTTTRFRQRPQKWESEGPWTTLKTGEAEQRTTRKEQHWRAGTAHQQATACLAPPLKVAARRKPCNHAVYQEQITYKAERHAGHCGQGHYLFGARCNHCRVKIGSKNNKEKDGERTIVPTSNAPLYVCVNIGLKDETGVACVQVICDGCWTVGTVSQSREAGAGRSSRSSIG
jgi:hypothetical protein